MRTSRVPRHMPGSDRGAALVVTLIVCTVLAVVVVALMQNTGLDRASSRGIANQYRAKLAAESGLAEAMGLLQLVISNNRAFIVSETNHSADHSPVLLIGSNDATIVTNMFPLMSGPLSEYRTNRGNPDSLKAYLDKRLSTNRLDTVDVNMGSTRVIQDTNSSNWYRAPWTYATNVAGAGASLATNVFRYAFIVVDEQARLNPLLHRGFGTTARTNLGQTAEEIRVDTEGAQIVAGAGAIQSILQASNQIVTPQTIAFVSGSDFESIKHLVSVHTAIDEDIIPSGYLVTTNFVAYADAGKSKYNLNDLATNTTHGASAEERATNLARIISANLPDFYRRDAGSIAQGFVNANSLYPTRVAAGIVDYVDSDSTATLGLNGEPAGKEVTPYVVMVAERNTIVSETTTGGSPPASVTLRSEFFAQLWNPYAEDVSGTVGISVSNRQTVGFGTNYSQPGTILTELTNFVSANLPVVLRPNEFKAVALGQVDQVFSNPTAIPSASAKNMLWWTNTSSANASLYGHPQFRLLWNGALTDMNRQKPEMADPANAGLPRFSPPNAFRAVGSIRWNFNHTREQSATGGYRAVGDPRSNFYISYDWPAGVNIAQFLWNGRQADASSASFYGQRLSQSWRARDFVRADAPIGSALTSAGGNPSVLPETWTAASGLDAPLTLRSGAMLSIGELGNVFDAAQVNDSGAAPTGGTPANAMLSGGGRSLRIGQPESPYWDVGGRRAMQLLDLFSVNPPGTNTAELGSSAYTNVPVMRGRINVNTAPKPVLAAVFDGLALSADKGIAASFVDSSKIADVVISNRPYSRISDLYKASEAFANGTNYIPNVPNISVTISNAVATNSTNYVAMAAMDRAREELFTRSVNLLGTQSRAFRVFVVGEALDRQSNAVSRIGLEASVEVKLLDDQSGLVQEITLKKSQ
jgi:type II secretory pathway component PulK